jgi:hypothetical protein
VADLARRQVELSLVSDETGRRVKQSGLAPASEYPAGRGVSDAPLAVAPEAVMLDDDLQYLLALE